MISRVVLEEQKKQYEKGRQEAATSVSAFNGAIECIDNLLKLTDQHEEATRKLQEQEQQKEEK